jgi:rubrerythrin
MNLATRNLAWKLNWFRQSELEGALLLGRMVGTVESRDIALRLTRHSAEEAEHSRLWAEVIDELDLPHIRIFRSYQSFYLQQSGPPATLLEVLSFTQVFERRVHRRFHEELRDAVTPAPARAAYARMIEDEKEHLAWVADWLRTQSGAQACLGCFEEIDRAVFQRLQPFEQCLWAVEGLGREPAMEPVFVL